MRTFVICLLLAAAVIAYASASAIPEYDGPVYDLTPVEEPKTAVESLPRSRRFTCDVLSFSSQWVTPNHAACAAKCMFKGRRGGTCNGGVCVCRNG